MANQELNRTLIDLQGTTARGKRTTLVLLALIVLALLLLAALVLRNARPEANTAPSVQAEQAGVAPHVTNRAAAAVSVGPSLAGDQPAYYTERYWDMAAALAASATTSMPEVDYAYYTERYWDMAAALAASATTSMPEEDYAYYTERYWILGQSGK